MILWFPFCILTHFLTVSYAQFIYSSNIIPSQYCSYLYFCFFNLNSKSAYWQKCSPVHTSPLNQDWNHNPISSLTPHFLTPALLWVPASSFLAMGWSVTIHPCWIKGREGGREGGWLRVKGRVKDYTYKKNTSLGITWHKKLPAIIQRADNTCWTLFTGSGLWGPPLSLRGGERGADQRIRATPIFSLFFYEWTNFFIIKGYVLTCSWLGCACGWLC